MGWSRAGKSGHGRPSLEKMQAHPSNESASLKPDFDIEAYFNRIGYSGGRSATLETLGSLHLHHALAIPFENLNPLLGLPVPLDIESLQRKIIRNRRGGYCYEQNFLFRHALQA